MDETSATTQATPPAAAGRGRLTAYRVVAMVTAALPVTGLAFVVASFTVAGEAVHRAHNLNLSCSLIALVSVPALVSLRSPARQVAPLRLAVAYALAMAVGGLLGRDFVSAFYYVMPLLVAILVVLHPARRDLLRLGRPDAVLLFLAIVALVPAVRYGLDQAQLQYAATTDEGLLAHIEDHHFSGTAIHVLAIALAALLAAFAGTGRRLAAWLVSATAALYAVTSLALSADAGATSTPWAIAILAWAVLFVAASEVRAASSAAVLGIPAGSTGPIR